MTTIVLIVQLAATLFMTGVIWIIQVVHYPLFARVGAPDLTAYANAHVSRITLVVLPPMVIELGAALLFLFVRPISVSVRMAWVGLALVVIIWLSTIFLQMPQHAVLVNGPDATAHSLLVSSNWLRTAAWSIRSVLLLWITARLLA